MIDHCGVTGCRDAAIRTVPQAAVRPIRVVAVPVCDRHWRRWVMSHASMLKSKTITIRPGTGQGVNAMDVDVLGVVTPVLQGQTAENTEAALVKAIDLLTAEWRRVHGPDEQHPGGPERPEGTGTPPGTFDKPQ